MEKHPNRIIRLTGWIFCFVSLAILDIVLLCQVWDYACKAELRWSNWICLGVGLAGAVLFLLLAKALSGHIRKKAARYTCMGILSLIAACLTFYSAGHYALTPGWDAGLLCENAQLLMWGGGEELWDGYFSMYPNNILLTWLLSKSYLLSDALGIPAMQRYFVGLAFQSLGFGLAAFLVYVCADRLVGNRHPELPLWAWFFMLIMVCASPWVAVMYSDSPTLILVMIEVWLYLKARESGRFRGVWVGLLFFTGVTAWYIKPQGSIFLIAAVLMTVFAEPGCLFRKENLKKTGALFLACLAGSGLAFGAYRLVVKDTGFSLNADNSFGPAHFFMMGLNTEETGTYSEADVGFSASYSDKAERTRADLDRAWQRIRKMGPGGLLEHAAKKTLVNYADGTFTWEKEGIFYAYDTYYFPWGSRWAYDHIPNFYIGEEFTDMVDWSCSWIFRLIEQCAWMAVLCLCIFAFPKDRDIRAAALLLALLGMTLFGLLFEARARYVFAYVPVYILAAALGAARLKEKLDIR